MALQDVTSGCIWPPIQPAKGPQVPLLEYKVQHPADAMSKNEGTGGRQQDKLDLRTCTHARSHSHTHTTGIHTCRHIHTVTYETLTLTLTHAGSLTHVHIHTHMCVCL